MFILDGNEDCTGHHRDQLVWQKARCYLTNVEIFGRETKVEAGWRDDGSGWVIRVFRR